MVRNLLLALLLPAFVLPEGLTLCLCRLLGQAPVESCCAKCCEAERTRPHDSAIESVRCRDCCIALPPAERSLDRTAAQAAKQAAAADELAPTTAIALPAPPTTALALHARAHHDPPRRTVVPITLPLRL